MSLLKDIVQDERFDIVICACASMMVALQVLIGLSLISSMIPMAPAPFVKTLFPIYLYDVRPEREMLLYRLFVMTAIVLQGVGLWALTRARVAAILRKVIGPWLVFNAVIIAFEVFCAFKMVVMPLQGWPRSMLAIALAASGLINIFWKEVSGFTCNPRIQTIAKTYSRHCQWFLEVMAVMAVLMLLWVTDIPALLGLIFASDKFYHLDSFVMMPGWAYLQGLTLNMDITSEYSTVIPAVIASIAQHMFGEFSYANVVKVFVLMSMVYFGGFYLLLRWWLKSFPLALAVLIFAVKLHMFHLGVDPIIWRFPSATVVRFWWDLVVIAAILGHIRFQQKRFIFLAGIGVGVALTWSVDTGVYLFMALAVYMIMHLYMHKVSMRGWGLWIRFLFFPFICAGVIFYAVNKEAVFKPLFWQHSVEFASLFMQGWGALPMTDGIKDKQFAAFWMGITIPLVYVWTLLACAGQIFLRLEKRFNILPVVLSCYGLGLYHYYIHRSAVTSFDVVALPAVLILCWWLSRLLNQVTSGIKLVVLVGIVLIALAGLLSDRQFLYYPNYIHPRVKELKPYEAFLDREFDFSKDAAMIDRLTQPQEKVAVISSFETALLMQAKRKPLFYYSPLIDSRFMRSKEFGNTYLHTYARVEQFKKDLQTQTSDYVFIERKLIDGQLSQAYYVKYTALAMMVEYLSQHYQLKEQGQYLVALVRK